MLSFEVLLVVIIFRMCDHRSVLIPAPNAIYKGALYKPAGADAHVHYHLVSQSQGHAFELFRHNPQN